MSKIAICVGAILLTIFILGMNVAGNYNDLVSSRNVTDKAWGSVETQYQRRFDLIDNLVASVKGAQKQEIEVFGKIADARSRYLSASEQDEKVSATNDLETNIALIPRLQEAYPELRSNNQVTTLMSELKGTEDGMLKARDNYNTIATNYNTTIQRFPKNIFANMFNFKERTLFKSVSGAEKAVKVTF